MNHELLNNRCLKHESNFFGFAVNPEIGLDLIVITSHEVKN